MPFYGRKHPEVWIQGNASGILYSHSNRYFNNSEELHVSIKQKTVDLYAKILEYQMHLAAHYHNSKMKQFADNLIIKSNWKSMIDEITKIDKNIASDLEMHQHGAVQNIEDCLRELSDNLNRSLEKIEENTQVRCI